MATKDLDLEPLSVDPKGDSTHTLKGGASASSRVRFSQRDNRLISAPPTGISLIS